jgi:hypothetical protein
MRISSLFGRRTERRKRQRHRAITTAWVRVENDPLPLVGVLWDVSEGGACLAVAKPEELPDRLTLLLERDDTHGTICRVAWRTKEQVGLQFVENADPIRRLIGKKLIPVE